MQPTGVPVIPSPFSALPSAVNPATVLSVIITLIFIWWAVYTFVVIYHWARFGRDSWLAVPSVVLHFFVSGWLFIYATGALH